jgi:Ca2+-binding EF-hand superfamily protein
MKTPTFYSAPAGGPRPLALAQGAVAAAAVMAAVLFLMGRGGQRLIPFSIGTGTPREGLLQVNTGGGESARPATKEVRVQATRPRPASGRLFEYFRGISLLRAIDTDHDLAISDSEMARSPTALRSLDRNRDGSLNPEECGFEAPARERDAAFIERARNWYMRVHPLISALDADANGTVSPMEIATAAASLRALDWNHDGGLTADELLPDPVVNALAVYMVRWDANGDGRISRREAFAMPKELRSVLPGEDVTESALRNEIRRRATSDGDGGKQQLELASRPTVN